VSDPYGLYNPSMETGPLGPFIQRAGSDGTYSYSAVDGTQNQPVRYVSFYDGLRLCNWLANGQGDGDTENGSYNLSLGVWLTRETNATWALASDDEWYKAAYYDPVSGTYHEYPNGSDAAPQDPTDETTAREMNFGDDPYWQGGVYFTSIGETTGRSPYGVSDLGGNVREWTETLVPPGQGSYRITRGGTFVSQAGALSASQTSPNDPGTEGLTGFRLAYIIPEPSSVALLFVGSLGCLFGWMHKKRR
jgi:formylglycine-generating enzyme